MKAPVGPPICTLEPPNREMRKPAMMAVMIPFSGVTPLAIPNAMARGSATIPTIMPAMRSFMNISRLYPLKLSINEGFKPNPFIIFFSFLGV